MQVFRYPDKTQWPEILARPKLDDKQLEDKVRKILDDVRNNGDSAVKKYTLKFDGVNLKSMEVSQAEMAGAEKAVDGELKNAIAMASKNIESFHRSQLQPEKRIITTAGVECWQKAVPVEKVGLYVPGGTAPLFSTVLMLAIPARIAGCEEIVLVTPPRSDGSIHPVILYCAHLAGITRIFRVGGVQAIAAMAFGTETIPHVYKIFGPGNQYVTAAKQLITRYGIAIDMPAGPSEVAVMADNSAHPAFVAADLLSQAEHGIDSQVLLLTQDDSIVPVVMDEIERQVKVLPRRKYAVKSLENSRIIVLKDEGEMVAMVNEYAPEHLIIALRNADEIASRIVNAGSVFIGNYTPESAGDYISGTNHTLPTNGYARAYSGVNMDSFMKKITFQRISPDGLRNIGPAIMKMAETEELTAHKNAVMLRIQNSGKND